MMRGPQDSSCINLGDSAWGAPPRGRHGGSALVEGLPSGWRQRWRWPGFLLLPSPSLCPRAPAHLLRQSSLAVHSPESGLGHGVFLMVLPACGFLIGSAFMASWLLSFRDESGDSRCVCGSLAFDFPPEKQCPWGRNPCSTWNSDAH